MRQQTEFNDLYARFRTPLRRFLARRAGEAEADDLTQTVFIKANRALPDFRGECSLKTWLYRIATNVANDWQRAAGKRPESAPLTAETGGSCSGSDQKLLSREMNDCIRGIVDNLPEQSRNIIRLREFDGLKNAEIAAHLGTSLDTVKIRLHRARTRLREELASQCHLYRDDRNELACDRKQCR